MGLKKLITNKNNILRFLCLLLVLERVCCLFLYNGLYVDSDQVLYWLSTVEMSNGYFYEPAVYGQAYNSFLESFLAIPLYSIGIELKYALPLITHLLALIPIFVLVKLANKKLNIDAAIIMVLYFLLLPAEYMFITSIPRGFITGLSACFIGIWFIDYTSLWKRTLGFVLIGFSFVLNPNVVLIFIPLLFYHLKLIIKTPRLYIYSGIGFIVPFLAYIYIQQFYNLHADYIVHPSPISSFNVDHFKDFFTVKTLKSFNQLGPLVHHAGITVLLFLWIASFNLKTEYRMLKIGIWLLLILIPLLFGFNKIHDGDNSVYFPLSRMFLALPLILGFVIIQLDIHITVRLMTLLISSVMIWVMIKCIFIDTRANRSLMESDNIVDCAKMNDFENNLKQIKTYIDSNNISHIFIGNKNDLLTYGIPATFGLQYQTFSMYYERRKWHLDKFYSNLPDRIIYISKKSSNVVKQYKCEQAIALGSDSLFILKDETKNATKFKMLMDSLYDNRQKRLH